MITRQLSDQLTVSSSQLFGNTIDEFISSFQFNNTLEINMNTEVYIDFELDRKADTKKICPILRMASVEDALDIVEIYKSVYDNYPYKEMLDVDEIKKMILNDAVKWIMFLDRNGNSIGCFTFILDFKTKRGYIRGLMIKREFQGYFDAVKATMASFYVMWTRYKDKIYIWHAEARTAHAKSQYVAVISSLKPIGFFPNKDIFNNKVESDLFMITYDQRVLSEYRSNKIPKIIPQAENPFFYSTQRHNLGGFERVDPKIVLNNSEICKARKKMSRKIEKDNFGYETIKIEIKGSLSWFKFLHTPMVRNFEKTVYQVASLEELYVFIEEFKKCAEDLGVRYYECFVSAYQPEHQKLFFDAGLIPRGYVPSWAYNSDDDLFDDYIIFNSYLGDIDNNIRLVSDAEDLLFSLGYELEDSF
jgi:hypothetical protein